MARKPKTAAAPVASETAPETAPASIPASIPADNSPAPINYDLLSQIVAATVANSFVYLGTDETASLVAAGLAEVNPGMVNDYGAVATRATNEGIAKMNEQTAPAAPAAETAAPAAAPAAGTKIFDASEFADIFAAPVKRSSSGRTSLYPFETLEVGKFFVVPATAEKPDPKKSLASTISSAERRFAVELKNDDGSPKVRTMKVGGVEKTVPVYEKTREFESREVADGSPFGFPGVKVAVVRRTK